MITILNFLLLLLLPLCLVSGVEPDTFCSTTNGESLGYTIRSRKNATNHRIVSVAFRRDSVPNKGYNTSTDIDMDVDHTYQQCDGKERIMLSTVASTMELKSSPSVGDYEFFPGLGFYKLHTKAEVWETARSICEQEGGHLIVFNSDAEVEVLKTFFSREPKFSGASYQDLMYVGVHDSLKEGQYVAVTGEPLDKTGYSRWGPNEPDGGTDQNYIAAKEDGLFYDIPHDIKYGYICEQ